MKEGYDMSDMMEMEKSIRFELEFLKNKLIETSDYTDKLLSKIQRLTNSECEYEFDEYPDIFSEKIYEDDYGYVSYENAIDEIGCENYVIHIETERVIMTLDKGKIDLILLLRIGEIRVKKRE
jgi:hypothetical protein